MKKKRKIVNNFQSDFIRFILSKINLSNLRVELEYQLVNISGRVRCRVEILWQLSTVA